MEKAMLDKTSNQPSIFYAKNWVKISSGLCDYSDAYMLVEGTVTVVNTSTAGAASYNIDKTVIFTIGTPFINCISRINNTQVDDAHDIDAVMPMYNLI